MAGEHLKTLSDGTLTWATEHRDFLGARPAPPRWLAEQHAEAAAARAEIAHLTPTPEREP